jgi:tetrahydromethanopterin S-methyltransferase subunit G
MSQIYVTQDEFKRLEARISAAEHEADGEKMLSRYILTQARQNGDDLAALKTRIDRIEAKVDRIETEVGSLRKEFSLMRMEFSAMKETLPSLVADAMREVLRESHGR